MRMSVALLRNVEAEMRAKEKAEAPTVKTKEQTEREQAQKEKKEAEHKGRSGTSSTDTQSQGHHSAKDQKPTSIWKRKFRPLPEAKAVDLFADVVGDAFILLVATGLIIYEYYRSSQKPDANLERIKDLNKQIDALKRTAEEKTDEEKRRESRILAMEEALRNYKDPKTKQPLLPTPTAVA
jgi:optic atrophy 3 protein